MEISTFKLQRFGDVFATKDDFARVQHRQSFLKTPLRRQAGTFPLKQTQSFFKNDIMDVAPIPKTSSSCKLKNGEASRVRKIV